MPVYADIGDVCDGEVLVRRSHEGPESRGDDFGPGEAAAVLRQNRVDCERLQVKGELPTGLVSAAGEIAGAQQRDADTQR